MSEMTFLGKGSKVDPKSYGCREMGVEHVIEESEREKKRWNWPREKEKRKDGNSGKDETGRFRAEDERCRNGVQTPEKLIEMRGEDHFARACLDIE
ncbi:hypothetical protein TNCV_3548881 [Trichonephila clavipes]|nr:hypothetical protein TNCV_3548881 [Trichonephila clavipes]